MLTTAFTDLVGCQVPIQQAGMGGVATPELAAAVADAGGLGMVSMVLQPADAVAAGLDALAKQTRGEVGINFLMPLLDPEAVDAAASRVRVVEFFYADPDAALVDRVHEGGALAAWQVGSSAEARAAVDAGCDFIVAQGTEAGGHVRGRVSLLPLLDSVLDSVDVPVVAAGGIATPRGVAAVLAAGAAGARLGTRFVATPEADAHAEYVDALLQASADDTVVTEAFSACGPTHRTGYSGPASMLARPSPGTSWRKCRWAPAGYRYPSSRCRPPPGTRPAPSRPWPCTPGNRWRRCGRYCPPGRWSGNWPKAPSACCALPRPDPPLPSRDCQHGRLVSPL